VSFGVARLVALDERLGATPEVTRVVADALAMPSTALLVRGTPHERSLLAGLPRTTPVVAVLPDMGQLLRDASDLGLPRAGIARLRRGGLRGLARLSATGIRHVTAILRQDFAGLLPMLLALERGGLGRVALRGVAVAAPMTDLLLASGYVACMTTVLRFVRTTLGVPAGLETLNLGHLLSAVAAWPTAPDFVIGPCNSRGFRMKPSPEMVRAAIVAATPAVLAAEATARQRVSLGEAEQFAREAGAIGVVVTTADLLAERK
jgi:hypothetical protein